MFLAHASVGRPVAFLSLILGLSLLGIHSYTKMGVEFFPRVDMPYVTVITVYPGAGPREIEPDVAKRIEDAVSSVDGLKHVISSCMENVCQTLLEFHLGVDVDIAAMDVREKIDLIKRDFPSDVEDPKILKFDINAKPILDLALTGGMSLEDLYDYADQNLSNRLSMVPGVAEVQLIGGSNREVHVLVDRDKLAGHGLTVLNVVQSLKEGLCKVPLGRIRSHGSETTVTFDAEASAISDMGAIEVLNREGSRCHLRDIASLRMASEERRQTAFIDGQQAIAIRVVKRAEANSVAVVRNVGKVFESIRESLPEGMELIWVRDDGDFISASVETGIQNIVQGILLTGLILFLFLHDVRSTLIVAVTMPLTVIVGLFFIKWMGYTLNISTLLAQSLSVGILVTNSIVVLESVISHMQRQTDPAESARKGTSEVALAVLASAGTNVVVLFPIASMSGMIGLFFKPFAWTMIVVTVVSIFISFTLTPILASRLLRPNPVGEKGLAHSMRTWWNDRFLALENRYEKVLRFLDRRRWMGTLVLLGAVGLLLVSLSLVPKLGFTFVKEPDQGQVAVKVEFPSHASLEHTVERIKEIEAKLMGLPHVLHMFTTVGKVESAVGASPEGVHLAQIMIRFKTKTQRTETIDALVDQGREILADIPNAIVSLNVPTAAGGQIAPLWMEVFGENLEELDRLALELGEIASSMDGIHDVDTTIREGKPELRVVPKRSVLSDLRISPYVLGWTLRGNLEGIKAASFKEGARTYDIRVKFLEEEGMEQVEGFLFPGEPGYPLTLASLADTERSQTPVQITRKNRQRIAQVFGNLRSDVPLGIAVNRITAQSKERIQFPSGYGFRFTGLYEIMEEAVAAFLEAGLIATFLTYLLLCAILESFRKPILILSTLPMGLIGVILALSMTGEAISIFVLLGSVMLIGIVVNNAILILDASNTLRDQGIQGHEAVILACRQKLRPILMITMAAFLGMAPLALSRGLGSEMRVGIGLGCMGGVIISAVLTLFMIPILSNLVSSRKN